MTPAMKAKILGLLGRHDNMTIATVRPDGYPQATTVGYVNDGLNIYFACDAQSQKAQNIARNDKVSAAIDRDHANWADIEGLSLGGTAARITDPAELEKVYSLFLAKFPQIAGFSEEDKADLAVIRVTPQVISVLDYSLGFGHSDLVTV